MSIVRSFKHECGNELALPYFQKDENTIEMHSRELGRPSLTKDITGDGNCFFRAGSYCLTCTESHHYAVRSAICNHILEHEDKFQTFLRSNELSVKSHVSIMEKEGNWATELEILGLAHMLDVNIYTFSNGTWLKFSGQNISASIRPNRNGLYLNHMNENHYDVVLEVGELLVNDRDSTEKNLQKKGSEENSKQTIRIARE